MQRKNLAAFVFACLAVTVTCAQQQTPSSQTPTQNVSTVSQAKSPSKEQSKDKAKDEMPSAECPAVPSASGAAVREVNADQLQKLLKRNGTSTHPLLVNFWATWCVPCREEFPDLVKIDGEFRQRGLDFFLVSLDDATEIKTSVPQFLSEMKATAIPSFLLNTPEPETAINAVDPQWSGSLPATFLFDRDGKIIFKHTGRIKPDELRKALNSVTE